MFPIDAIKQARTYTLFADDLFARLDFLLTKTPYQKLRDEIALEVLYHYLYESSNVPELTVTYSDLCLKLMDLINDYTRIPVFQHENDIAVIAQPIIAELDLIFNMITLNRWGMYTAQINRDTLEISYVGDYRIIQWSQTDDANKHRKARTTTNLYAEQDHSFKTL